MSTCMLQNVKMGKNSSSELNTDETQYCVHPRSNTPPTLKGYFEVGGYTKGQKNQELWVQIQVFLMLY